MNHDSDRYQRQIAFFGAKGQDRLGEAVVGFPGLGGLGGHLVQHFAYLGVRTFVLVDGDTTSDHGLNRQITARPGDVGQYKVDLAQRMIHQIAPNATVTIIREFLPHPDALAALSNVDLIVAGLDHDRPRLQLTDLASSYRIPYIDAATDIHVSDSEQPIYGGRIIVAGTAPGCLSCLGELDNGAIRRAALTDDELAIEAASYGVPAAALRPTTGPSVVTINGVVASLAATEAMVLLTGLRPPQQYLVYRGDEGIVRRNATRPAADCPYCHRWLA